MLFPLHLFEQQIWNTAFFVVSSLDSIEGWASKWFMWWMDHLSLILLTCWCGVVGAQEWMLILKIFSLSGEKDSDLKTKDWLVLLRHGFFLQHTNLDWIQWGKNLASISVLTCIYFTSRSSCVAVVHFTSIIITTSSRIYDRVFNAVNVHS